MKHLRGLVLVASFGAAAGCSWKQTPVQLIGDSASIVALVGSWEGNYSSAETGRTGAISFRLASERDTAYGDVLMVPRAQPRAGVDQNGAHDGHVNALVPAEPLKIRFVRLENGRVSGTLDTYKDPSCGCALITTFDGGFTNENTIEGSFHTRGTDIGHQPASGRWKVTRQKSMTRIN